MRKEILRGLLAITALPVVALPIAAQAQTRHEIREDRRETREDRRELREDMRNGASNREIRRDMREVNRDRREVRRDRVRYRAPYRNWTYRTLTPGYRLQSGYYGRNYYITDYGRYRLHRPGFNQRWIRYGDDLLLVNVRTGRVIQVLRNRYW